MCDAEFHDKDKFQAEGHFVPGHIRGSNVFALNLHIDATQVLRAMGNNMQEAAAAMSVLIADHFVALERASRITRMDYETFRMLNDDRNRLQMFVNSNYAWEIEHGQHAHFTNPFAIAAHYMRIERRRLWRRFLGLFRRTVTPPPVPSDGDEFLPKEWRE